jgi:hypothetical protein
MAADGDSAIYLCANKMMRFLIIVGLLILGAVPADAATYYVNQAAGHDAYDGLAPNFNGSHGPKATYQAAAARLACGDTVTFAATMSAPRPSSCASPAATGRIAPPSTASRTSGSAS